MWASIPPNQAIKHPPKFDNKAVINKKGPLYAGPSCFDLLR
jgi:hypothetical protein